MNSADGLDQLSLIQKADEIQEETYTTVMVTTHAGHDAAVDFLDRVEENTRFHVESLTTDAFATAKGLFRQHERFSFVDACLVAYMQVEGLGYLYAFDDDFDDAEDVYRLDVATDPYQPE